MLSLAFRARMCSWVAQPCVSTSHSKQMVAEPFGQEVGDIRAEGQSHQEGNLDGYWFAPGPWASSLLSLQASDFSPAKWDSRSRPGLAPGFRGVGESSGSVVEPDTCRLLSLWLNQGEPALSCAVDFP